MFGKKEKQLTKKELKWNQMWNLWEEGKAESPFAELMTYQSETNNGGHSQYFTNIENVGDLQKEMSELEQILYPILKNNLVNAYKAYSALEKNAEDEKAEEILEKCDDVFYENEEKINHVLEKYSEEIEV